MSPFFKFILSTLTVRVIMRHGTSLYLCMNANITSSCPANMPSYYTLDSLSVFSLAKSLQLTLEISATYRLISYLLVIC